MCWKRFSAQIGSLSGQQNRIYVEFDEAGLLRQCVFVPINCADDCSEGVSIHAVRIGDDAPECCPPDPAPSCCMAYGGAEVGGKCGGQKCDGMPRPEASRHRELDDYGCPKWVEPPPNGECCGCL